MDVDSCSNENHPIIQSLEQCGALKIEGCIEGKFSVHYITRISESVRKLWQNHKRVRYEDDTISCDMFIGNHVVFGPGSNNKVKKQEFKLNPSDPFPETPANIIDIITSKINKIKPTVADDIKSRLSTDAAEYVDRPLSMNCRRMGDKYLAYMDLAKQYHNMNNNNITDKNWYFGTGRGKSAEYNSMVKIAKEIHNYILKDSSAFTIENGMKHPDTIRANQGGYNMLNKLSLTLAIDPSVDEELAKDFLLFYNEHFSKPIAQQQMEEMVKRMFTDKYKDPQYGKTTLNRFFYDPNHKENMREFGLLFTGKGGAKYHFVMNVNDNYFYLLDYEFRVARKLYEDRKKSLDKAAELIGISKDETRNAEVVEFNGSFVYNMRRPFGVDYVSYKERTRTYEFNLYAVTRQMEILANGITENPDDNVYYRSNGDKLYNQKNFRAFMLQQEKGSSRVPRKSLRILREIFGCYSCTESIRKEALESLEWLEMLVLYRSKNQIYDAGMYLIGDYRSGKDMIVERFLINLMSPHDSTKLEFRDGNPENSLTNDAAYKLTKQELLGLSGFNAFMKYKVLQLSDVFSSKTLKKEGPDITNAMKGLLSTVFATLNEKYKAQTRIKVDTIIVVTSNTIIPLEKSMGRISVFRVRTRGNLVEYQDGVAIRERRGRLYNVPWVARLRFQKHVGPLPDDMDMNAEYNYKDNSDREGFETSNKSIEGVDPRDVITGGKALGEYLRWESEAWCAYLHHKYIVGRPMKDSTGKPIDDPKVVKFRAFKPEIPVKTSALNESYGKGNPAQLFANLVGSKDVNAIARKLVNVAKSMNRLNIFDDKHITVIGDEETSGKVMMEEKFLWFGPEGDRLYLHNIAWCINHGSAANNSEKYKYSVRAVEDSLSDFGCEMETLNENTFTLIDGLKVAVDEEVKKIRDLLIDGSHKQANGQPKIRVKL